ncbi:MAG: DNA-3-methyladenine glycosylase [Candidatus Eisenbacteria bacterium]|uniref:Putative 3-methyladenine DNA glycosylase n=1 Tax=Eiseniibacteriota bacterium TaxID=2212470 RepID=A0A849SHY9_UNCEI|nr:DNA-3-methyladenine glycosylase [Candidatus Eisenbacteria bacterium]
MKSRLPAPEFGPPLPRHFFDREPAVVARALLGRVLVRREHGEQLAGRIVEVEAYGGARDAASHAFRGATPRNLTMFGPPGRLYVYLSHGIHHCINVVTGARGVSNAVLIRALEPLVGLDRMRERRGGREDVALTRGPGCVAQALGLSRTHDGLDLVEGSLWIADRAPRRGGRAIATGPRIGVSREVERRWRFFLSGHPCVSGARGMSARPELRGTRPERQENVDTLASHS